MLRSFGRESGSSSTERLRREIAREIEMDARSGRLHDSLRHSTLPRRSAWRSWDDASDVSDDYPKVHVTATRSPGNHSILLATPGGASPPRRTFRRPALSREESERINFSIGEHWDLPKASTPGWQRNQPSSRHSSAETKVDDTEAIPEHLWADAQLDALVKCITTMESELSDMRTTLASSTEFRRLSERVDALEAALDGERTKIAKIHEQLGQPSAAPAPAPEARESGKLIEALAQQIAALGAQSAHQTPRVSPLHIPDDGYDGNHLYTTQPPPSHAHSSRTSEHPVSARTIQKLFDELARVSLAVDQLHREAVTSTTGSAPATSTPATAPLAAPLPPTPPLEPADINWVYDGDTSTQERYERICRTVADALGLAPGRRIQSPTERLRTRKDRIRSTLRQREALDAAASPLLSRLEGARPPEALSAHELQMLERLFEEHRAEFIHQRRLYSELADELKRMEPSMDRTKRRILAEHVHESIDTLEAEATRINELHIHIVRYRTR